MSPFVYLNGRILPAGEAFISVHDGGWLHGAGLFETMRVENGHTFRLDSHYERLLRSARLLLQPVDRGELPDLAAIGEFLKSNGLRSARLRLTMTAGPMNEAKAPADGHVSVCLTASPLGSYPEELYEKGVAVAICPHRLSPTDPLAGHKTTAYLSRLLGLRDAQGARCTESLWFTTDNRLAEGSISNVFVVRDDLIMTPPLDTPVLPGITRGIVLELADQVGLAQRECPLTIDDLLDADEVFLTNSIMQVMPVIRVERHDIAGGKIGPIARRLLADYRQLVRKECGVA